MENKKAPCGAFFYFLAFGFGGALGLLFCLGCNLTTLLPPFALPSVTAGLACAGLAFAGTGELIALTFLAATGLAGST